MNETLVVRIKKDYAINVINDLETTGAIELLTDEDFAAIPDWQKEEVLSIKRYYEEHPDELLSRNDLLGRAPAERH